MAPPNSADAGDADAAAPGGPRRVLIIEYNPDAAETLRELLELWGHEVAVAFAGHPGRHLADEFRPDVVLLDIGLPDIDGYAAARDLRKGGGAAHARIVALTGYGQEDYRRQAREAGIDRHLTKPVDPRTPKAILEG